MKFRKATRNDLAKIVEMIADDELGKTRENYQIHLPTKYLIAFENIDTDIMLPYLIEIIVNGSITTTRLNEKYFILENNLLDSIR